MIQLGGGRGEGAPLNHKQTKKCVNKIAAAICIMHPDTDIPFHNTYHCILGYNTTGGGAEGAPLNHKQRGSSCVRLWCCSCRVLVWYCSCRVVCCSCCAFVCV